jgi:hypothetical protein
MMSAYSLYCDAAGGEDHGFIVVAGYLSNCDKWQMFEEEWKILLAENGLPYFHMKEFAQSKGPFANWKDDEDRRASFLSKAAQIIKNRVLRSFACLVEFSVFDSVAARYPLKDLAGNPYALAGRSCVAKAGNSLEGVGSDVTYVFEDGDKGKGELMRIMERDGYPLPVFRPSRDRIVKGNLIRGVIPLQAADFAAYEIRKHISEDPEELKPLEKYRKSIAALAGIPSSASDDWGKFREQELIDLCKNKGDELR